MKLFISWSGEFSKRVAECLSTWIPTIIQSVDPFYSPNDIAKGENWSNRLSDELEQSNFGIVCLTPENIIAPWIHFEAGALSKAANSRVSTIMLNITPSQIKGPLARLQNTSVNQDDFYKLFKSINDSSDSPLKPEILKNAFENSWEKLSSELKAIIDDYSSAALVPEESSPKRNSTDSEAIQEILRLVRSISNKQGTFWPLYSTSELIDKAAFYNFYKNKSGKYDKYLDEMVCKMYKSLLSKEEPTSPDNDEDQK